MIKRRRLTVFGAIALLIFFPLTFAQIASGEVRFEELGGLVIEYDVSADNADGIIELMNTFMLAYSTADRATLSNCVTEDFLWHLHQGPESPNGRTVQGVDGLMGVLAQRGKSWSEVKYRDIKIYATKQFVTQTFRVSGIDADGVHFDVNAVDLYPLWQGKIAAKSSYWKQLE